MPHSCLKRCYLLTFRLRIGMCMYLIIKKKSFSQFDYFNKTPDSQFWTTWICSYLYQGPFGGDLIGRFSFNRNGGFLISILVDRSLSWLLSFYIRKSLWCKERISYDETDWDGECALLTCSKLIREHLVVPQSYLRNIVWSAETKYVWKKGTTQQHKNSIIKRKYVFWCIPDRVLTSMRLRCFGIWPVAQVWCAVTGIIWWWR